MLVSAAIGLCSQHGFAADMLEARTDLNSLSSVSIFNYSRPGSAEEKQAALELNLHGRAGQPWHAASFLGDDEKRIQLGLDIEGYRFLERPGRHRSPVFRLCFLPLSAE